jgi:hypothetical protein
MIVGMSQEMFDGLHGNNKTLIDVNVDGGSDLLAHPTEGLVV